ncbi:MAG TPA: FlgO family outer membrane protein [Vicinamibacterales bacterium]|nr:FlgO family outer membrane protein [Vicinamibacterales bacterium]
MDLLGWRRKPQAENRDTADAGGLPSRINHYRVRRMLGHGGMGVVYLAEDERLGRDVALKVLRDNSSDPTARVRLVREARIAAGISHPLICQVFELGEWNDQPFIAMELVDGEPLAARLTNGALPPAEALRIAVAVVEALGVLHRRGIMHRDLKPSNVFVTDTGVKVLDFGLARPVSTPPEDETADQITHSGVFLGTPRYAAPEQLLGDEVDERADLFSAGVVLFEMLAGRPPFSGKTLAAIAQSVLHEAPPVLTGSPAVSAADRILHRALSKKPEERYPSADTLVADLRAALQLAADDSVAEARPMLRLAVLPFRLLKRDPDTDYLGLSLADALVSSLSGLESLVVRSTLKTARYANTVPDLEAVAATLAVDVVLTGSMLRSQDQVRVSAELVSVPAGDVWWSQTTHVPLDAVIDLHDELARRVIASLPLTTQDRNYRPRAAGNAKAFDLYLHGMRLRGETASWRPAHVFFEQCLALDPAFAPAWAERGRLERLFGKYEDPAQLARAESSFLRALELDPENGAAQLYYAQLEIDLGRLDAALARLLERVRHRRAEPHIYAALVHACRYGGLLDESLAAHRHAQRLDPTVSTSVHHTYYMQGDYEQALASAENVNDPFEARVVWALGRDGDALERARREEERFASVPTMRAFSSAVHAAIEGRLEEGVVELDRIATSSFADGEGLFYIAGIYVRLGQPHRAVELLARAIDSGFLCARGFETDVYLEPLRAMAEWQPLLEKLEVKRRRVMNEFVRAGGRAMLA